MNPNTDTTKAGAAPKAAPKEIEKLVKIQAIRQCQIGKEKDGSPVLLAEGEEAEVPESVAKELCDKGFPSPWPFGGERSPEEAEAERKRSTIYRAKRIS